jgi:hypothetical protein
VQNSYCQADATPPSGDSIAAMANERRDLMSLVADKTDHIVIITDDQRRIICINDAFTSLREACRQIAEWRDAGTTCLPVLATPDLQSWLANRKRTSPRLLASGFRYERLPASIAAAIIQPE